MSYTSLTTIGSEAFVGLPDVDAISVPDKVVSIANNAFDEGVVIIASHGSFAEVWANENKFAVLNP